MVNIKRTIYDQVKKSLFKGKIVVLYGARQVGKTTLLNQIRAEYGNKEIVYLNCDEPDSRRALTDVSSRQLKTLVGSARLLLIDEAQRVSNIGLTLKLFADSVPEVQVVATGSSSFDLANKVVEPLTGRIYEFTLYPFSFEEIQGLYEAHQLDFVLGERLVFGMYPEIVLKTHEAPVLLKAITRSYLYKDILSFQKIRNPEVLERLLQALALQIGHEVSYNELALLLNIDKKTVASYIQLLEKAFIVFRLRPYHRNLRTELRKLRKIYFYDTGVRNAVIDNLNPLELRQDVGALWENWLVSERMKALHNHSRSPQRYFWRTHQQQEIDYLEESGGKLAAFEFKWKKNKLHVPKAFREAYPSVPVNLVNNQNVSKFLLP